MGRIALGELDVRLWVAYNSIDRRAGAVFVIALFSGHNSVIDNIRVMNSLESDSHTERRGAMIRRG